MTTGYVGIYCTLGTFNWLSGNYTFRKFEFSFNSRTRGLPARYNNPLLWGLRRLLYFEYLTKLEALIKKTLRLVRIYRAILCAPIEFREAHILQRWQVREIINQEFKVITDKVKEK